VSLSKRARLFFAGSDPVDMFNEENLDVPESVLEKLVDNLTLWGTPADVDQHIERLQELERRGLNEVALKLHEDQAHAIRVIGEHLVPALSDK
jgi:hypothetical protein